MKNGIFASLVVLVVAIGLPFGTVVAGDATALVGGDSLMDLAINRY